MYRRKSKIVLLIVIIITAAQLYFLKDIQFDYDLKKFFPVNSPETDFFLEYSKKYEWDDDFVLLGLHNKQGIFQQSFLLKVDSLSKQLKRTDGIVSVVSPTTINVLRKTPFTAGVVTRPFINIKQPEKYASDSTKIYQREDLVNRLFAKDGKSVALLIKQSPDLNVEQCDSLSQRIDGLADALQFDEIHYAGKCFSQTAYVNLVRRDVFFLWISYKKLWSVWMPLLVISITVIWTIGTMAWMGEPINFVSNIIPTILMIIGISNVIHLFTKYRLQVRKGYEKMNALRTAVKEVGFATIFTSLTTILSFLTLTTSDVDPLVKLGFYAALGLVFAFILTYSLFPAMLILYRPAYSLAPEKMKEFWQPLLFRLYKWVNRHPSQIIAATLLLTLTCLFGASFLRINNHLVEDLKSLDPQRIATGFFEEKFSGTRQYELAIDLKDPEKSVFDRDILIELEQLDGYMTETFGNSFWFSPVSLIKSSNRIDHGGNSKYYSIPTSQRKIDKLRKEIEKNLKKSTFPKVYTVDGQSARFSGQIPDIGSYVARQKNRELQAYIQQNLSTDLFDTRITGTIHLNDLNGYTVAYNVVYGLLFCLGFIMILVGYMFRSWRMSIITLIANVLPLILIAGLMGFMDVDIKIPTAIIFIIAFGIAVDDSIHFLSKLKIELNKGKTISQAIRNTYLTTGKAIVVTSLILSGGFLTLALSNFTGTYYIGLFTSLCLLFAVAADLILLPVLILKFYKSSTPLTTNTSQKQTRSSDIPV